MKVVVIMTVGMLQCLSAFCQEGSLKNVIIKYDTTYECNNMRKSSDVSESYVDKGLKLYVYDGPFLLSQVAEQKNGRNNGIYLSFYISSNMPKEKGMFVDGYEEGEWFYWNEKGALVIKKIWRKGKVVKSMKYNR